MQLAKQFFTLVHSPGKLRFSEKLYKKCLNLVRGGLIIEIGILNSILQTTHLGECLRTYPMMLFFVTQLHHK
jgi:hypothetical protein